MWCSANSSQHSLPELLWAPRLQIQSEKAQKKTIKLKLCMPNWALDEPDQRLCEHRGILGAKIPEFFQGVKLTSELWTEKDWCNLKQIWPKGFTAEGITPDDLPLCKHQMFALMAVFYNPVKVLGGWICSVNKQVKLTANRSFALYKNGKNELFSSLKNWSKC